MIITIIILVLVYVLYKSDTKGSGKAQQYADRAAKDADAAQQIADQAQQVAQQTTDPAIHQAIQSAIQHATMAQQSAQQATQHAAQASSDDDSHTMAAQQAAQATTYHLLTASIRAHLTDAQLISISVLLQSVTTQKYISPSGAMVTSMADAQKFSVDPSVSGRLLPAINGTYLTFMSNGPPDIRGVLGEYGYGGTGIRVDGSAIYGVQISEPADMLLAQYYPLFGVNIFTTYD